MMKGTRPAVLGGFWIPFTVILRRQGRSSGRCGAAPWEWSIFKWERLCKRAGRGPWFREKYDCNYLW